MGTSEQDMKAALLAILGTKTVSYKAVFARALKSVPAAVMLSQAFFTQENAKKKDSVTIDGEEFFCKTSEEWEEETGLSKEQQKTARKLLVKCGMMKEKLYGMPATIHFRMVLSATVDGISAYKLTGKTVDGNPVNTETETPRTSGGRFRKQDDGNSGDIYKEESKGELKGEGESENPPTPAESENPTPVEAKEKKDLVPPAAAEIPAPPDAPAIDYLDRPNAKTAVELKNKLSEFYQVYDREWEDGVLEMARGKQYDKARRIEIITLFCCHAIKHNMGSDTYQVLNAALQKWFLGQKRADAWSANATTSTGDKPTVYTPPPVTGTHQPAYVP